MIAQRSGQMFLGSLAIVGIQNWVSMRWSTLSVALGVGIGGTFVALFASGWEYGYLYPWLIPIRVLHGEAARFLAAMLTGAIGGVVLLLAALYDSVRRELGH